MENTTKCTRLNPFSTCVPKVGLPWDPYAVYARDILRILGMSQDISGCLRISQWFGKSKEVCESLEFPEGKSFWNIVSGIPRGSSECLGVRVCERVRVCDLLFIGGSMLKSFAQGSKKIGKIWEIIFFF